MPTNALAIDLGTSGVKVAIINEAGAIVASAGETLTTILVDGGGAEQDPQHWWQAIGRCAQRAISRTNPRLAAHDVTLVAVTSQYSTTIAVTEDGTPLANAMMWMDQRGGRNHPAMPDQATSQRWLDIQGMTPSRTDNIGHISYIRTAWPEIYGAARAFVEPMDYIVARLTGSVTATQNTMFPTMTVDNRTWGNTSYSDELLSLSGIDPAKLPTLVPMGTPRGVVTGASAEHLGVSPAAVVTDATMDSVTSAVGTGAVDATRCGLILGTTAVMATHLESKRYDPDHGLTSAPSPIAGSYFLVAENGVAGKTLEVFVNNMVFADDGLTGPTPVDAYDRVLDTAATSPPGANGVMFHPWMIGSLAPGFQRRTRGSFANISLTTRRADMARAVLEGIALNAAWLLPYFSELAGHQYDDITIGGGTARSPLLGQILANCFARRVRRLKDATVTNAHGAGLLALVETGHLTIGDIDTVLKYEQTHEPDTGTTGLYALYLESFVDFHDRTAPFYAVLNDRRRAAAKLAGT